MKKILDNILLSILWLLLISIGCLFWCEQKYNFNIFSKTHWKYLSELQATNTLINNGFYLSLIISLAIGLLGLYIIIRPHFKCTRIKQVQTTQSESSIAISNSQLTPDSKSESSVNPTPTQSPKYIRPPRLTLNQPKIIIPSQQISPSATTVTLLQSSSTENIKKQEMLQNIFSEFGYSVKKCKKIGKLQPDLVAINSPNIIWIGAIAIESKKMTETTTIISDIFNDTLDDIEIQINTFIVQPLEKTSDNILYFDTTENLKQYISEHPATEITDMEKENFDAYSEYIDTVLAYIGKI